MMHLSIPYSIIYVARINKNTKCKWKSLCDGQHDTLIRTVGLLGINNLYDDHHYSVDTTQHPNHYVAYLIIKHYGKT